MTHSRREKLPLVCIVKDHKLKVLGKFKEEIDPGTTNIELFEYRPWFERERPANRFTFPVGKVIIRGVERPAIMVKNEKDIDKYFKDRIYTAL